MQKARFFFFYAILLLACNIFSNISKINFVSNIEKFEINNTYYDTISVKKFLKKVTSALSIRKNLRRKEAQRIDKIVKTYFAKDSINLSLLSQTLEGLPTIAHFDSLIKILTSNSAITDKLKKRVDSIAANAQVNNENSSAQISDKEIQSLVEKIVPLITEKAAEEEAEEQKQKKIKLIRQILASSAPVMDSVDLSDSTFKKFRLNIRKKEVFGYHPSWMNKRYFNYNFSVISTLVYYGFELNGKTGKYNTINGWDTAAVINKAKREGCKVQLAVYCTKQSEVSAFLNNTNAQTEFFRTIVELLKRRNADGVNIMFEGVGNNNRSRVTRFIRELARELKEANPKYAITLTLPCLDVNDDYDVEQLQKLVSYFIIDFTKKNEYGPLAPLSDNEYSIKESLNRYLAKKVPSEKFIACLPYHAARWDFQSGKFMGYIPYNEVLKSYVPEYGKVYDKNSCVHTDIVIDGIDTLEQIWYDDAKTLSAKYDYVLSNNLSGVGIWALGNDDKRTELWDALLDKLVYFDTSDIVIVKKIQVDTNIKLSIWDIIRNEWQLYKELFQHPCHFESSQKMEELKSDDYIGYLALVLILLLAIVTAYSIYIRMQLGDDWKHYKLVLSIQIILVILVMISLLMYCFLNPDFYQFGTSVGKDGNCEMSFDTILIVLGLGFLCGLLAMRFLVIPLLKPKEIP